MPEDPPLKKRSFRRRSWSREEIVEAIRAWFQTYGEPPRFQDWAPKKKDSERAARYRRLRAGALRVPSSSEVSRKFGSWNAAIEAAGLPVRPRGGRKQIDRRTRCAKGHLLDEENTLVRKNGRRVCRRCKRAYQKASREKRRRPAARTNPPPGLILGRPSGARDRNAREARRLRAEGLLIREIGERLGLSRSTVSAYLADPEGLKDKARRERYRRPCPGCGELMSGGEGRGERAPKLCAKCSLNSRVKFWTRERVIDAIQRYAAEHGDAPTSAEWRLADPERGYPCSSQVYGDRGAPFDFWADAIEAAGFPRPMTGYRRRSR